MIPEFKRTPEKPRMDVDPEIPRVMVFGFRIYSHPLPPVPHGFKTFLIFYFDSECAASATGGQMWEFFSL